MIFKLLGPLWLTLLIVVALAVFAVFVAWRHWSDKRLRGRWLRRAGIVLLIAIMCLRPSVPGGSAEAGMTNLNVFFVVDTTTSMSAEDFAGDKTRLSGVTGDIKVMVAGMAGARFSVITFDSTSYLETPLTSDATAIDSAADAFTPQLIYNANGSDISQPLDMLTKQLQSAQKQYPDRVNLVYYISDGEQTSKQSVKSFAALKQYVAGGGVLGYGTTQGGKMKNIYSYSYDDTSNPGYIMDYSTQKFPTPTALSKINEANLQKIATDMGVKYTHRTSSSDADKLVTNLGATKLADAQHSSDIKSYLDIYWLFAGVAAILLLVELRALLPIYRSMRTQWRNS